MWWMNLTSNNPAIAVENLFDFCISLIKSRDDVCIFSNVVSRSVNAYGEVNVAACSHIPTIDTMDYTRIHIMDNVTTWI